MYSVEQIKKTLLAKGYTWFNDEVGKNFDVNIVGIRNSATGDKVTNLFDDLLTISYKEKGEWKYLEFEITTEAGKKGVLEFQNKLGVARLIPNQYRGAYSIALHQGKYEALCQRKPVAVWRDKNKDLIFDESPIIYRGLFGINIHRSNPKTQSTFVENWSEGCQVFKKVADFNKFMDICKKAVKIHGNSFTYTLITSNDLV
jgi:hypothetical protein